MLFQKKYKFINGKNQNKLTDSKRRERICTLLRFWLLFPPMNRRGGHFSEKASLCASLIKEASIAVETALVLPLFFLGMVTLISFMDIYKIQTEHLQILCEKAKEAGMYAYVLDGKGPAELTFPDVYSYQPVGGLLPLPAVRMHNTVKIHAWTGADHSTFAAGEEPPEEMVYVTESGSVYHRNPGCRYLHVALNQIPGSSISSAHNAQGEKYYACEICSKGQKPAGMVYITKNGNKYHNRESCSGLKRTVRLVKISEVQGMGACGSCG